MALLNRWDPFSEIARLQDEFLGRGFSTEARRGFGFTPAVDIFEDKDAIYVKAELPGVKPDEVNVNVENNILTVSGERKLEKEDKKEGYHRIERTYGSFTRSFALPNNVSPEKVEADMADGVLTVKVPKREELQPKKIEVRAGMGGGRDIKPKGQA